MQTKINDMKTKIRMKNEEEKDIMKTVPPYNYPTYKITKRFKDLHAVDLETL